MEHASVISLLLGDNPDPKTAADYAFSLDALQSTSPTIIAYATELSTTGSELGQGLARNAFMNALETIHQTYDRQWGDLRNHGVAISLPSHCPGCFGPELRERLLIAWTGGNTLYETNHPITEKRLFERMDYGHKLLQLQNGSVKAHNRDYWRGLAALVIALEPNSSPVDMLTAGLPFVHWIGNRSDLHDAVVLAQSRDCFNPETLEGWLEARADIISPFHEGVL